MTDSLSPDTIHWAIEGVLGAFGVVCMRYLDRLEKTIRAGDVLATAAAEEASKKAEKAQEMAVHNLERIHDAEVRATERNGKLDTLRVELLARLSHQDLALEQTNLALGRKASKSEMRASQVDPREKRASSDPPPMRPRLPTIPRGE